MANYFIATAVARTPFDYLINNSPPLIPFPQQIEEARILQRFIYVTVVANAKKGEANFTLKHYTEKSCIFDLR